MTVLYCIEKGRKEPLKVMKSPISMVNSIFEHLDTKSNFNELQSTSILVNPAVYSQTTRSVLLYGTLLFNLAVYLMAFGNVT